MARILVTLDGTTAAGGGPLLCHNERLSDPLEPITMELAKLSGQRKKTEAIHLEMARLEFAGGLYHDDDPVNPTGDVDALSPYLPTWNIIRCIQDGATRFKLGKDIIRALIPVEEKTPIGYDGPRGIKELWDDGRFASRKGVAISGRRVIRTRPMFVDWRVTAELELDLDIMTVEKVDQCVFSAGKYVGIGDNRPSFGRFKGSAVLAPTTSKSKVKVTA